ncbi:DUF2510 domain-containing protein [Subtercola endophyticus]|uniref:DUF2510 domain-containing protein n=1 Tax=Subtercola endophyticus TaxID=2895559 RepID=UPI0036F1EA05
MAASILARLEPASGGGNVANASAAWYPVHDGRLRWWNGILWTDHFHEPAANLPPAGWYADTRPD